MNTRTLNFLSFFSILLFFVSCSGNENKRDIDNNLQFETINIETGAKLIKDSPKPECSIKLNLKYPHSASNQKLLDTLSISFIENIFGNQYTKYSFNEAAQEYINAYIADYQKLNSEINKSELESSVSFNYSEIINDSIYYNKNGFLCYGIDRYSYTGGAHGNGGTSCYAFDILNLKYLSYEDIFLENYIQNISDLIVAQIIKNRELKSASQLSEDGFFSVEEIAPNNNFYFDETGITWIYNPYEIAVYAIGKVVVTLNWNMVKDYISESSPLYDFVKEITE